MQHRYLGKQQLKVSAIGYGCPTFQGKLGDSDERRDIDVLHRAIDLGINFIDTADHNNGNNEELLAKALKGKRVKSCLHRSSVICAARPGQKGATSMPAPNMCRSRVKPRCAGCSWKPSICTICIASIRSFRSRIPSALWFD